MSVEILKQEWWPTPIWYFKLDDKINFDLVTEEVYKLRSQDAGKIVSNLGGWQSNFLDLNQNTEINNLLKYIESIAEACFNDFGTKMYFNRKLTDAWVNINQKGHYNTPHNHPDSILSGCVYIKASEKAGNIRFEKEAGVGYYSSTYLMDKHIYNHSTIVYPALEKQVLIFPSYLLHSVEPNQSDEDRISIAFNFSNDKV
jgi:uncharacterized protein (TIGR02466 family)